MKRLAVSVLSCVVVYCAAGQATPEDPIGDLVAKLHASGGMWINGLFRSKGVPDEATPEQVVAETVKHIGFDRRAPNTYRIREVRQVDPNRGSTNSGPYTAVWVEISSGAKVLLYSTHGVWSRWYEVQERSPNQAPEDTARKLADPQR